MLDLSLKGLHSVVITCHHCGSVSSVIRLNGSPREFTCTGCGAGFRIWIEDTKPPERPGRIVQPSRTVAAGKC